MSTQGKSGGGDRKKGRNRRRASALRQTMRTYENALRKLNRQRARLGLSPLGALPTHYRAHKYWTRSTR